jgi:hypothetical protein
MAWIGELLKWLPSLIEIIKMVIQLIGKQGINKTKKALKAECEKCRVGIKKN